MSDSYSYHCDYVDSETNEHLDSDYYYRWNDDDLPPDGIPKIGDVITIKGEKYYVLNKKSHWESEMTDLDDHGSDSDEHCYLTIYLGKMFSVPPYSILVQDNSSCAIIEYTGAETVVKIPVEIDGKTVVKINARAFSDRDDITEIIIPDSISEIKEEAFMRCRRLDNVFIPDSITEIGKNAFLGCTGLTNIVIPKSVTKIGEHAFYGTGLMSIMVDESNSTFDSRDNCNAIIKTKDNELILGCKNTVIPNSVTRIGKSAFSGCDGLTSIVIPNSVTRIGEYAFSYCTALNSIIVPDTVIWIESGAFSNCSSLQSIIIPNSVTRIGDYAFSGCEGLTSIVIPNSVTEIEYKSFKGCTSLSSVVIPNSVTKIAEFAFSGCTALNNIIIPDSVNEIERGAFEDCTALRSITIPNSVINVHISSFKRGILNRMVIPDSITRIGAWVNWINMYREYGWCQNLEMIEIGKKAFDRFKYVLPMHIPKKVKIIIIDGTLLDRFSLWLSYLF